MTTQIRAHFASKPVHLHAADAVLHAAVWAATFAACLAVTALPVVGIIAVVSFVR